MTRRLLLIVAVVAASACRRHRPAVEPEVASEPAAAPPPAAPNEPAAAAPPSIPPQAPGPGVAYAMPDGGTINGDPRGPRAAVFNQIVQAALPRLQACFDAAKDLPNGQLTVTVHYVVEPPGYTGAVRASGPAPQPVLDCCSRVFEGLQFPQFRGPKVEQNYPVTYVKRLGLD
jgi:hypothetical protein